MLPQALLCAMVVSITTVFCAAPPEWYMNMRNAFIQEEQKMRVGMDLVLSDREQIVNKYMMTFKTKEIKEATTTFTPYLAAGHFFRTKPAIDNTTIFQIIKKMPKGGALHLHDLSVVDLDWLVKNMTYLPGLYMKNATKDEPRRLRFFSRAPGKEWVSLAWLRKRRGARHVDQMLINEWSIWTKDPFNTYTSENIIWKKFGNYFKTASGLRTNVSLAMIYLNRVFEEFHEDNVQYFELRDGNLRNENGTDITASYMRAASRAQDVFKKSHPDFIGMKFILGGFRFQSQERQQENVDIALQMIRKFPRMVKGFDLDSHEDEYHRIFYYINQLVADKKSVLPYFFHAGESDWTGQADMNLIDAILLNSTRIGHGFAALKHPKVMEEIKRKEVVVELNPISNQVLGLIGDLRNHPGSTYLANGYRVVVSSDDFPLWRGSPLSHDFYMAFMALGSSTDDLRLLKQLAINSLMYSTMTAPEKRNAMLKWQKSWNQFIEDTIKKYNLLPSASKLDATGKSSKHSRKHPPDLNLMDKSLEELLPLLRHSDQLRD